MGGRLKLLCCLVILALAVDSQAANVWHVSTIKSIYPQGNGTTVVLIFDTDSPSCANANTPNYYYIAVGQNGVTAEGLRNMYAAALAAAAAGLSVTINFDDGTTGCYINRLLVAY